MTKTHNIDVLAVQTLDAYSANRYSSWRAVVSMLLRRGYSERETEAILRSKWMRWAADNSPRPYGRATYKDVERFLDNPRNKFTPAEVHELVAETFPEKERAAPCTDR